MRAAVRIAACAALCALVSTAHAQAEPDPAQDSTTQGRAAGEAAQRGKAERSSEDWGYELADEIMSPFCPGRALSECPSQQAVELRSWILDQESAGVSRTDVEAELFRAWGDQLLQAPRAEGVGLVAYGIPAVFFAGGGLLVALFLRRQARASAPAAPAASAPEPRAPGPDAALEERIEAELREDRSEGW